MKRILLYTLAISLLAIFVSPNAFAFQFPKKWEIKYNNVEMITVPTVNWDPNGLPVQTFTGLGDGKEDNWGVAQVTSIIDREPPSRPVVWSDGNNGEHLTAIFWGLDIYQITALDTDLDGTPDNFVFRLRAATQTASGTPIPDINGDGTPDAGLTLWLDTAGAGYTAYNITGGPGLRSAPNSYPTVTDGIKQVDLIFKPDIVLTDGTALTQVNADSLTLPTTGDGVSYLDVVPGSGPLAPIIDANGFTTDNVGNPLPFGARDVFTEFNFRPHPDPGLPDHGWDLNSEDPIIGDVAAPCIELVKEVSNDGLTWHDANDPQCSDAPSTLDPAQYRLTVKNCGTETLTDIVISDPVLGITNYPVGDNLVPDETKVLTSADISQLNNPNLCPLDPNNPNIVNGGLRNIARVDGMGITSGRAVYDEDPACIRCVCIDLVKEVSSDGLTWHDANDPQCSDAPSTLDPAQYRLTVKNCGTETLTDIVINDPVLGITNYPVGDNLVPDETKVLTSADISQLNNPNLCPLDPNNPDVVNGGLRNIASVDAVGITSGMAVFDEDPACIRCVCVDLVKEVSSDGLTWHDANAPDCSDAPSTFDPAKYRLTVKNCGTETLTNIVINDTVLSIANYAVGGNIPAGGTKVLTSADIPQLNNPNLCPLNPNNPDVVNGGLRNIASVDAVGITSGVAVFDEDPACIKCKELIGGCRMTGGHNTVFPDGNYYVVPGGSEVINNVVTLSSGKKTITSTTTTFKYTVGGQIGAPEAGCCTQGVDCAPGNGGYGEWEHSHHENDVLKFGFHAGTNSSPPDAYIKCITCADPGWCVQARCAPFKQIFWEGTGVFQNPNPKNDTPFKLSGCTIDPKAGKTHSLHAYQAHVGDFGEPGNTGNQKSWDPNVCHWTSGGVNVYNLHPMPAVPDDKFEYKGGQTCDACPDWYEIEVHCTASLSSPIIYRAAGYLTGGNHQIHPEVGQQCPADE